MTEASYSRACTSTSRVCAPNPRVPLQQIHHLLELSHYVFVDRALQLRLVEIPTQAKVAVKAFGRQIVIPRAEPRRSCRFLTDHDDIARIQRLPPSDLE